MIRANLNLHKIINPIIILFIGIIIGIYYSNHHNTTIHKQIINISHNMFNDDIILVLDNENITCLSSDNIRLQISLYNRSDKNVNVVHLRKNIINYYPLLFDENGHLEPIATRLSNSSINYGEPTPDSFQVDTVPPMSRRYSGDIILKDYYSDISPGRYSLVLLRRISYWNEGFYSSNLIHITIK